MEHSFGKLHRIHLKNDIQLLFDEGKKLHVFPFVSYYRKLPKEPNVFSVLISVPKKRFKKAHDRNRIKRLIRECVRIHREKLMLHSAKHECQLQFSIVYLCDEILEFERMNVQLTKLINSLCNEK
jgi:ribonuclease P protein component